MQKSNLNLIDLSEGKNCCNSIILENIFKKQIKIFFLKELKKID